MRPILLLTMLVACGPALGAECTPDNYTFVETGRDGITRSFSGCVRAGDTGAIIADRARAAWGCSLCCHPNNNGLVVADSNSGGGAWGQSGAMNLCGNGPGMKECEPGPSPRGGGDGAFTPTIARTPRTYTLAEIDRMRVAIFVSMTSGAKSVRNGPSQTIMTCTTSICVTPDPADVERRLQTAILAGISPEALEVEGK